MPGIEVLWLAVGPLPEGLEGGVPEPAGWELPDDGGLPDCDVGCPGGVLPDGWLGGCDPLGGILAGGMLLGGVLLGGMGEPDGGVCWLLEQPVTVRAVKASSTAKLNAPDVRLAVTFIASRPPAGWRPRNPSSPAAVAR